ncbi:MAG: class I SAM-dependent methyltransferase family protein [Desulfurococcales archaeon]|nr:class I SAM-dependent methyltransferase family protein [Desulfurococcales archaeon]
MMPREETYCIAVPKRRANESIKILSASSLLSKYYKIASNEDKVYIPVISIDEALKILLSKGIDAEACFVEFERKEQRMKRLTTLIKSYSVLGDIAVFSYTHKIPVEEYKRAAMELLSNNKNIRAVYLKKETSGEYRTPILIHLAGEKKTVTRVKEYGLLFELDVEKVYYNQRLSGERRRVAEQVKPGEKILDMFAGIGVFPLHIASITSALIVANDINPYAVNYMIKNIELNKKRLLGTIIPMKADAMILDKILREGFDRIIMNNPTMVAQFLPIACKLAGRHAIIHYYRLAKKCEDVEKELTQLGICSIQILCCRKVIDHGPSTHVFSLDLEIKK